MAYRKKSKIPRFYGFRIYFSSTLLYFFLVLPVLSILTLKYGPEWTKQDNPDTDIDAIQGLSEKQPISSVSFILSEQQSQANDTTDHNQQPAGAPSADAGFSIHPDSEFGGTISLLLKVLVVCFILGLAFNLPFKIYFKKKRKNKEIPEKLHRFCKKFLLRTPIINAGILFLAYGITLGYMAYILFFNSSFSEITQRFYEQFFFITFISSLLTLMFVYFWYKHRVHIKYIDHVFTKEELKKRIFKLKEGKIRNRLLISSAMTTLLPALIIIFYLFISISKVNDLSIDNITDEQVNILIGKYTMYFGESSREIINNLFYVNVFDSMLMFGGIFTGILIALIYIFFFIRWTTQDIVKPVKELLNNMQRTGRGEMNSFSVVRTNDEIGELTEEYNDMSQKLMDYIVNISRMNEANARFVPKQFLDFLGKENIADIKLGDQVQKDMTILFSDIRDFTSISEQMTPKENFNFLNNYLGYMEPVIRNNNGFIDKFMGDSIMALFPDNAENAINAAIEMKIKLFEFNHIISQFGQNTIETGIGIHTGMLMLGVVGGEGRMDGTVISDAVNLTARLEGLTKFYGSSIIISEDTLIRISDPTSYHYRFLDVVKVKGKKKAIYIFEILDGEPEDLKQLKLETKPQFSKGLQLYKDKKFKEAEKIFMDILQTNPEDKAAENYIERCAKFIKTGFPDDWDGIEKF